MRPTLFTLIILCLTFALHAQTKNVYTITADSVKLTSCDSSELIIENHTQNVPGFLFNTGNGRTIFKRAAQPLGDTAYIFGADTVKLAANAWVQGGNRWGTTRILGTLDNNHLDLYANDTQRVRVSNIGNLLIGTTTDNNNKLQVNGPAYVNGPGAFYGTVFVNAPADPANGDYHFLQFPNSTLIGGSGYNMELQITSGAHYSFQFGAGPNLGTPVSSLDFIKDPTSGNIGINSSSNYITTYGVASMFIDASPMSIATDAYSNSPGLVVARGTRSTNPNDPILSVVQNDTIVLNAMRDGYVGIGTSSPTAQLHTTGSMRFAGLTNDNTQTQVLVTDASGNVFYRSASSLADDQLIRSSLVVNGPVSAQQLTLTSKNWPDYVFDSAYKLPSLRAVEAYIRKEHHLPGISSAAAIQKDGLDIGVSTTLLTKKIEELTLYSISQEKKLDIQATKLEAQEKELAELKTELDALRQLIKNR